MLLRREAVRALAGVEGRLLHPVPDRLGRGLKLAPELLGRSAMPDQLDHLPPERRRVRPMALRHRGRSLPPQPWGVHETGSTPNRDNTPHADCSECADDHKGKDHTEREIHETSTMRY